MFYVYANGQQIYKPLDEELVILNPKLILELGKAGSLEFDIPPVNPLYDRLDQLSTEISVDMDDDEIFHGRVLSNERAFSNIRHIYCEGDLSYLVDSVQKGVRYDGTTHALFRQIIANHNARMPASKQFTVGTINIANRDIKLVGQSEDEDLNTGAIDYEQIAINSIVDEWNNTFDYIQTCLIDYCGGYLRTRRVNGTLYIDLLDDFQNRAIQPIELGSNLLDLTEEISAEDVFTVLIPLGDDNLTIASVNGGSDEIVDSTAVARFGRIIKTHVFNNVTSASTLLENAQRFMATNVNVPRTINVKAVDLHLLNPLVSPIRVGDRVVINSPAHDVDDELTCTRIEYDLEKPENNSYIFGNPRQTLTQRYREDARLSNDTYGNSAAMTPTGATAATAASPAKAASSAASAAGAAADKVAEKALNDFYDAWVDFDPDQATVSLGALSKQYYDGKEVLMSQCGIDLDGKTGNINIQSLHNVVDDHGNMIASNEAYIRTVQTDTNVALEQVAARHSELEGVVIDNNTAINQRCDDLSATIDLNAKSVREFEDSTNTAIANINMVTNDHESRITQSANYISNVNGVVTEHTASITALANEQESIIRIKADKTYVDGLLEAEAARLDKLMSGNSTAQHLLANTVTASTINLKTGSGSNPVVSTVHSHRINTTENNDGTVTISIGSAVTDTIPQKASFDIANTKKYKAGVAAVSIKAVEAFSYSSTGDFSATLADSYVRYSSEQIVGRVRVTLDNNTQKSIVVKMAGKRAYDAGVASVKATAPTLDTSWSVSSTGYMYRSAQNRYEVRVKSNTSNGQSLSGSVYVSGADAYNAGYDAVTISSIGASSGSATYQSGMTRYVVPVTVSARASNGAYDTNSVNIYVGASDAYNAGYNAGQAASSGYTNIYYTITDSQTSSKIVINIVVYGYNGSYYEQVASGRHEYNK